MSTQNPSTSIAAPRDGPPAVALVIAAVAVFALSGLRAGAPPTAVAGASICFAWLFTFCVAPGTRRFTSVLRVAPRTRGALVVILAAAGFAAYAWAGRQLDPRAFVALPLPRATQLLAFEVVLLLVTVVAPLPGIGYSLALDRRDLRSAGAAFAIFAFAAIPLGLVTGFLRPGWRHLGALEGARGAFDLVFLVALPEELLFRGLLQNALERRVFPPRRWTLALGVAALVFGASHLGHPPVPNWRYGMLATLAGIAYGWTWHRTGKITASALVHAAVDLVWVVALGGP